MGTFLGIIAIVIFIKFFWANPLGTILWIIIGGISIVALYLIFAGLITINDPRLTPENVIFLLLGVGTIIGMSVFLKKTLG